MILPTTTKWMQDQMLHEPTREYAEEIYYLVKRHPYKSALEIGNAWGVSTLAILLAGVGNLTSVDPNTANEAVNEVRENDLKHRFVYLPIKSAQLWQDNGGTFDLIYIDGSHLYEDFKLDVYEAWKVLDKGGLLFWDDFTHPNNLKGDPTRNNEAEYGISLASWEFIRDNKITQIETTERLLSVRK